MDKILMPIQRRLCPLGAAVCLGLFLCGTALPAMDNCWTSISEPIDYQLSPSHGELGIPDAGSQPGIREKTATWTGSDGACYLFGGTSLDAVTFNEMMHNDLWRFDSGDNTWIWISGSDLPNQPGDYDLDGDNHQTPGARNFAVAWTGADSALYLFGGYGFDSAGGLGMLNDLWRYDVVSGEWTWLKGAETIDQTGHYGDRGVTGAANTPGGRYGSMAWTDADGKLYLFGGYGLGDVDETGFLNDLWVFDPEAGEWAWLTGVSVGNAPGVYGDLGVADDANAPGGRAYAAGWVGESGEFYLFGGARYVSVSDTGSFNDLWRYESATNQWTWIKGSPSLNEAGTYGQKGVADDANNPPSRSYANAWKDSSGALYLFGGLYYDANTKEFSHKNDLWRYDTASGQWTWLHGGDGLNEVGTYGEQGVADAANTPGARSYASVWTVSEGGVLLYGGHGYNVWSQSDLLNDFWSYNPADNQWTWFIGVNPQSQNGVYVSAGEPDPAAKPSARQGNGAWATSDGDFYLFGGRGVDGQGQRGNLNDLWRYEPASAQWIWLKGGSVRDEVGVYGDRGVADSANTPGARDGIAAWSGSEGNGFVFGGQGSDSVGSGGRLNDLWRYEPVVGQWIWLAGSNSANALGDYGTQGVADAVNTPGSRSYAAAWRGADGKLYLFGGSGYDETGSLGSLNDLWRYDPAVGQWTWLSGGKLADQVGSHGVQGVTAEGNMPGARYAMLTWTGPEGALYLYGGLGYDSQGNLGALSDLWRYDAAVGRWTWLQGSDLSRQVGVHGKPGVADAANTPGCRMQSTAWTGVDGLFYFFGGFSLADGDTYYQQCNDLWRYNSKTNRWSWLRGSDISLQPSIYGEQGIHHPSNTPGARAGAMAWTASDGRLYLFGGSGYDAKGNFNELNDLWFLEPGRLAASGWLGYP